MKNTNKIMTALGVGVAVGAVLGVLFAPRKGSETRRILAQKGNDLKENIRDGWEEGQKKMNSFREGLRNVVENVNKKVEEVM